MIVIVEKFQFKINQIKNREIRSTRMGSKILLTQEHEELKVKAEIEYRKCENSVKINSIVNL